MRKATLWVCAAALALSGIACDDANDAGEGGPVAPGVNALSAAAENAGEAGSSAFTMKMTMDVAGQRLTGDAEGVFDFDRQVGEMTMTISGPGIPPRFEGLGIEMIVDREYGYMRMPDGFGLGRAWYRAPTAPRADVAATGLGQLTQDPSQFLEFLRLTSEDDVEEAGVEEIRGVATTHYETDVSFEKALEQAPNQEAVEDLEAKMGGSLATLPTMPVDVWIDEEGLPRRIEVAISDMELSVDLFDYGAEVDVAAPEKFKKLPKALRG